MMPASATAVLEEVDRGKTKSTPADATATPRECGADNKTRPNLQHSYRPAVSASSTRSGFHAGASSPTGGRLRTRSTHALPTPPPRPSGSLPPALDVRPSLHATVPCLVRGARLPPLARQPAPVLGVQWAPAVAVVSKPAPRSRAGGGNVTRLPARVARAAGACKAGPGKGQGCQLYCGAGHQLLCVQRRRAGGTPGFCHDALGGCCKHACTDQAGCYSQLHSAEKHATLPRLMAHTASAACDLHAALWHTAARYARPRSCAWQHYSQLRARWPTAPHPKHLASIASLVGPSLLCTLACSDAPLPAAAPSSEAAAATWRPMTDRAAMTLRARLQPARQSVGGAPW